MNELLLAKVEPSAIEVERRLLGICSQDRRALDVAIEMLPSHEVFHNPGNRTVYQAMLNMVKANKNVELLGLIEQMKAEGTEAAFGGPLELMRLQNAVNRGEAIPVGDWCRILIQKFIKREIIRISGALINDAYNEAVDDLELQQKAEQELMNLSKRFTQHTYQAIDVALVSAIKQMEAARNSDGELVGVTSGYPEIDSITGGWRNGDLIILAARPSVGKSILAAIFGYNAAKNVRNPDNPTPVGFFSLEMSTTQNILRLISTDSGVYYGDIERGRVDDNTMNDFYKHTFPALGKLPIYLDDTSGINLYQLASKARAMVAKHKVGLIIIDYLQLMNGTDGRGNREQEISSISRGLKTLAKELQIPIIALSQLSRETEKQSDGRPKLSNLRESGAIEQDADTVMFIWRPEYNGIVEDHDGNAYPKGYTELIFAKNRNGTLDTAKLIADLAHMNFKRIDASDYVVDNNPKPQTKVIVQQDSLPF